MDLLPLLLSLFFLTNGVSSEFCYYHEATSNSRDYLDCGKPKENVIGIFTPNSTVPELTKGLLSPFTKATSIYIGKAGIIKIHPEAFSGLKLTNLHLNGNNIKNIEPGTLNSLNTTTQLELYFNEIEVLKENTFSGMTSLVWLGLSANKIKTITKGTFNGLENLENLFLGSNQIQILELGAFDNLISLKLVELYRNLLIEIPLGIFRQQRNLEKINLSNNKLKSLPGHLFDNVTALSEVDISENQLEEIPEDLFIVNENLKVLKFERNHVRHLNSKRLLVHLPNIEEVHLNHNPWTCEELRKIRGDFEIKNVYVPVPVPFRNGPNVEGVKCTE